MRKYMLMFIFFVHAFTFHFTNSITPNYLNDLGVPKSTFGYFAALWSLGMLLSSPLWGYLGDKYGKKKFIVIGLFIYGFSQLMFYFTTNLYVLLILRVVSGIGVGAPVTILLSVLINEVSLQERTRYLSLRMAFITLGGTISYFVSGYLGLFYTRELFVIQSLLSLVFILFCLLIVKKDEVKLCAYPKPQGFMSSFKELRNVNPKLTIFFFSISLSMIAIINTDKFIDLYIIDSGYNSYTLGSVKLILGIIAFLINFILIPRLKKYIGNMFVMQTMQILMGIIILIVFFWDDILIMMYTLFLPFVAFKAIYQTSEQLFISAQVKSTDVGLYMGLRQSFICVGMVVGPIIGGYIYQVNPENLFSFNVVCLLISSLLLSYIKMEHFKEESILLTN